jgi:hypothetical protein
MVEAELVKTIREVAILTVAKVVVILKVGEILVELAVCKYLHVLFCNG